jgi:hypothetical protein
LITPPMVGPDGLSGLHRGAILAIESRTTIPNAINVQATNQVPISRKSLIEITTWTNGGQRMAEQVDCGHSLSARRHLHVRVNVKILTAARDAIVHGGTQLFMH